MATEMAEETLIEDIIRLTNKSCCGRLKLLFHPIISRKIIYKNKDAETHVIIVPEAFRMLFYICFAAMIAVSAILSTLFSDLDVTDNPIIHTFGVNSACIFLDYPPVTYFAATMWISVFVLLLFYEYFDYLRVYDHYHDDKSLIGHTFYNLYAASSVFETCAFMLFVQCFATTPFENIYVHTIPYLIMMVALWTMSMKKFLYLRKIGLLDELNRFYQALGWIYVILHLICFLINWMIVWPNLFGAELWKQSGLEWTGIVQELNSSLFLFLVVICPMVIYFVLIKDLSTMKVIINRATPKKIASAHSEVMKPTVDETHQSEDSNA